MKKIGEGLEWYWWSYEVLSDFGGFWVSFFLIILKVLEEAEINRKDYVVVVYISLLMKVVDELKSSSSNTRVYIVGQKSWNDHVSDKRS